MTKSVSKIKFRRRKENKTNYAKRLSMVIGGKPRIVVRKTNKYVYAQGVFFDRNGDKTEVQANSKELEGMGWKKAKRNTPSAYLTGLLFGTRALKKNRAEWILDIGFNSPVHGGICFAVLKGALDAGLKIPFDEKAIPKQERIAGKHLGGNAEADFGKIREAILNNGGIKNG